MFNSNYLIRDGLGPKSLRGDRFHNGHRNIAEKASQHFEKASIPLKMYLKSLFMVLKSSFLLNKSLHFSENVF
jgi:hypothetical protein